MQKRALCIVLLLSCSLAQLTDGACQKSPTCRCSDESEDSCATCWGTGCTCKCDNDPVGIIRGSSFVAVGLERQDAFETYERRIVSNATHFISQWHFFIICDSCSHGLQVQNSETIITSTYAHGNLIQNTTDDVPSNFFSSPYPSLNPPRLDTLTIQIIGNINAFWFFGGRVWYWVFTPVWSKVEFSPADISQEPTVPEQIEVPDSTHNQPTQSPPILSPTSKVHSLPKWAWAIALGSVTLNVLAILACVGYRIHLIRSNRYSRASESEYEKLKMDSNRE